MFYCSEQTVNIQIYHILSKYYAYTPKLKKKKHTHQTNFQLYCKNKVHSFLKLFYVWNKKKLQYKSEQESSLTLKILRCPFSPLANSFTSSYAFLPCIFLKMRTFTTPFNSKLLQNPELVQKFHRTRCIIQKISISKTAIML